MLLVEILLSEWIESSLKHLEEFLVCCLVLLVLDVPYLLIDTDDLFNFIIQVVLAKGRDVFEVFLEILMLQEDALFLAKVLN